jgi:sugar phosphate isomerase/epimerase
MMTEQNPPTKFNSTQDLLAKMAEALERHGITIHCPWDGDLDDEEQERYEGLVAVLDVVEASLKPKSVPGPSDGPRIPPQPVA